MSRSLFRSCRRSRLRHSSLMAGICHVACRTEARAGASRTDCVQERPCGLDRRNRDEQRDGRGRRVANVRVSVQGKGLFAWAWASWAAATHVSFDATAQFEGQFLDLENAIRHSLKSFGIRKSLHQRFTEALLETARSTQ